MDRHISLGAVACALVFAAPVVALADNGTASYYTPPKLATQGKNTSAVAGAGTVVVKVLVAKTGAATVQGVLRSTNHGDDAAALEIARNSTYRPALRETVPQTSFYDFALHFGAAAGGGGEASARGAEAGGLATFERQIRAGNYAGAHSGLKSYVGAHPSDARAQLDLGVASAFLNDAPGAVAAFDHAGNVPERYRALAAKAYNDAASENLKAKDFSAAVSSSQRAVTLAPGPFTYNTLGAAQDASGDHTSAIASLEKARSLAAADPKFKATERARIDANLVAAYLGANETEKATSIVDEIAKIDPTQIDGGLFLANYYAKSANDLVAAGKYTDAVASFEKAAVAAPSRAAALYSSAALTYLKVKPNPDNERAKAEADKALAIDPDNASANFAEGIALANQRGKTKDALVYLDRADASAKKGSDPSLTAAIENVLKQLGGK